MSEKVLTYVAKDYYREKMGSSWGGSELDIQEGVGVGASWWNKYYRQKLQVHKNRQTSLWRIINTRAQVGIWLQTDVEAVTV